jgi:heme-degrading monooxygenase HmoA
MHLAQINIARMLGPINSEVMAGFVARLDDINALADGWPGFVWRLQGEGNNATDLRPFDDDMLIVNMSVWESMQALKDYVYKSDHIEVFRRRREWFEQMKEMHMALWWVPVGHVPTVEEAKERLEHLRTHGPTPHTFTFAKPFEPEALGATG